MREGKRTQILAAAAAVFAFAVPFAAYLITLARTITFEDSGQLIVAAARLGISHPSGYPLAALVGQLFTHVPVGRLAWRVNLASAAAAAFACLLFFFLLRRLFGQLRPQSPAAAAVTAAAAAAAFGLSRTFWSQAVVTEVYALDTLMVVAVLYAGLSWAENGDGRWGLLWAFLAGLALAAHTSSAIVTVPLGGYLLYKFRRRPAWRPFCLGLALAAFGFLIYIYLPLRAVQRPAINWGEPRTLVRAYYHITRRAYGGPALVRMQFYPHHLLELARFLWREFTPPAVAAMAAGLAVTLWRRPRPWGFFALLLVITGPLATAALVLLLQGHQLPGIVVWYIPFFMFAAAFLGLGVYSLVAGRRRWLRRGGYGALAAVVALPLTFNFYWNDFRRYYFAEDYGANFLRTIGYDGYNLMFERGSLGTFETAYLKKVEAARPDHTFIDGTGSVYSNYKLFAEGRLNAADAVAASVWERNFERDLLATTAPRPFYYSIYRREVEEYGYVLEPKGMLYRVFPVPPRRQAVSAVWPRYRMRGVADVVASPATPRHLADEWARDAVCKYKTMLAREYLLVGDDEKALALLARTAGVAQGMTESLAEFANIYLASGRPRKAIDFYNRALRAFPRKGVGDMPFRLRYAQIFSNRAVAYLYLGDVDGAAASYAASLAAFPDQPETRFAARRENLVRAARELSAARRAVEEGR